MGFKPLPWVDPLECWSEPGHILVREYDGSVTDYESTIRVSLPHQCIDFNSKSAYWVLHAGDSFFCGNNKGTYQQVRFSDGVLLTCGTWAIDSRPRTTIPCGVDEDMNVCELDAHTHRIIYVPSTYGAYVANQPITPGDVIQASMHARAYPDSIIICTEKGVLDLAVSGAWVPKTAPTFPYPPIQL